MIKSIQTAVSVSDDRDYEIRAIDKRGDIQKLYDIKFTNHSMLTDSLISELIDLLNMRLRDEAMTFNETPPEPTKKQLRRAEAVTRQIMQRLGMKPN